jgi:membrane protein YdbS with pleckstrin-like domain
MLNDGEEIILDRNPHWSFMLGAAFFDIAAFLITVAIGAFDVRLIPVGLLIMLFALIGTLGRYLTWRTTSFTITTDRIVLRMGILSKQGIEIPLERVMNISYHQAVWERILGTGDLIIESAGENGHQPVHDVANPSGIQNLLYRQMEIASNGPAAQQDGMRNISPGHRNSHNNSSNNGESIPEQIERLGQLRDKGMLTDEEFERKKRDLLDRM